MRHTMIVLFCSLIFISCSPDRKSAEPSMRKIALAELEDRIRGGWAGQMIGVTYGGPTEFRYLQKIIDVPELPNIH